jgi:hypothetical protein
MGHLLQKRCQVECVEPGVAVGVGVANKLSVTPGDFWPQEASTTDPVINSTTLRDFFTKGKASGLLAHRCSDNMADADYNRSAQDAYGDILVLAHLSFEIKRRHQIE